MEYILSKKYDTPELQALIMGPNPVKLEEELLRGSRIPAGAVVCDLGSGTGLTSVVMAKEYGFTVYAADLWSDPDENRRFFRRMGLSDGQVIPVKADATAMPFEREFFDAVVSTDSYNYFGRDPEYLDAKLAPFVKSGGYIYIALTGMKNDCHDALPEELAELFRSLEDTLLDEICSRLALKDQLNEVTVQAIRALRSHGIDTKEIEKAIRKTSGISEKKLKELFDDVISRNQKYYTSVIDMAGLTQPDILVNAATIEAIRAQTLDEFHNITASMGFLVDKGRTMLPPARAYQWALDSAVMQIQSGAISYNQAIKTAVKELADSGLKVVDYKSGHRDHADVAVRRAVMTGVNQICDQYTNQSAEYLETRYFEVSAHSGARDKPGASPWSSHKDWQGKVYYQSESGEPDPLGLYDDLVETTGYGYVDGLTGANCRHHKYPFVPGVSERTYTDEQLKHIDDGLGCTFDGKTYTAYEATQMQRKIERTIRKLKREKAAYKAAGLTEEEQAVNIRLRRLNAKYKSFSAAAGLPEQRERMKVLY